MPASVSPGQTHCSPTLSWAISTSGLPVKRLPGVGLLLPSSNVHAHDEKPQTQYAVAPVFAGSPFRPLAYRLDGVDISQGMIEQARRRGICDHLDQADLLAYLKRSSNSYDLVIGGEVFRFFSDVKPLFRAVRAALKPRGYLAFSIDRLDGHALRRTTNRI